MHCFPVQPPAPSAQPRLLLKSRGKLKSHGVSRTLFLACFFFFGKRVRKKKKVPAHDVDAPKLLKRKKKENALLVCFFFTSFGAHCHRAPAPFFCFCFFVCLFFTSFGAHRHRAAAPFLFFNSFPKKKKTPKKVPGSIGNPHGWIPYLRNRMYITVLIVALSDQPNLFSVRTAADVCGITGYSVRFVKAGLVLRGGGGIILYKSYRKFCFSLYFSNLCSGV